VEKYINTYAALAVEEMQKYGIPASITLAQGILESGSGNSELSVKANNHFGIKCHRGWKGKTFYMDDDARNECFRKYSSPVESYRDHSKFLSSRDRYAFLFELEITDYKSWARGLKKAGYATNPRYADLLIRIIEENELYRFDDGVMHPPVILSEAKDHEGPAYDLQLVGTDGDNREIYENNRVKCIIAREGDTWYGVAGEFGIYGWQVRKYNELSKKDTIWPGEVIYLERKRGKAEEDTHLVQEGQTMRNISQYFGVKLNALYRKNQMDKGSEAVPGTVLKLK
jgi:LysM repeat protein